MLQGKKICFIGTGNMGEALVSGLVSNSTRPEDIICTDVRESTLTQIGEKYRVRTTTDNQAAIQSSDIVIFAVKPQILALVLKETAECLDMSKLIISIAAGVPLMCDEPQDYRSFRLGLFGLDKLMHVDRTVSNLERVLSGF